MSEYLIWVLQNSQNLFDIFGQSERLFQSPFIYLICTDACTERWERVSFWILELGFKPMTHFLLKYSNGYGECSTNVSNQLLANFPWSRLWKHRIQCPKRLPDSRRRHILRDKKWLTSLLEVQQGCPTWTLIYHEDTKLHVTVDGKEENQLDATITVYW